MLLSFRSPFIFCLFLFVAFSILPAKGLGQIEYITNGEMRTTSAAYQRFGVNSSYFRVNKYNRRFRKQYPEVDFTKQKNDGAVMRTMAHVRNPSYFSKFQVSTNRYLEAGKTYTLTFDYCLSGKSEIALDSLGIALYKSTAKRKTKNVRKLVKTNSLDFHKIYGDAKEWNKLEIKITPTDSLFDAIEIGYFKKVSYLNKKNDYRFLPDSIRGSAHYIFDNFSLTCDNCGDSKIDLEALEAGVLEEIKKVTVKPPSQSFYDPYLSSRFARMNNFSFLERLAEREAFKRLSECIIQQNQTLVVILYTDNFQDNEYGSREFQIKKQRENLEQQFVRFEKFGVPSHQLIVTETDQRPSVPENAKDFVVNPNPQWDIYYINPEKF